MSPTWNEMLESAKEAGGFDPLPVGRYDIKIGKSTHKISQTGKSMFEVEMTVINGPHANRKVWDRYVVTPDNAKALAFFFSKMKILGLGMEFFAAQPSDDQVANALLNAMCTVELGLTEYNGSTRNEVRKLLPLAGAMAGAPPVPVVDAPVVGVAPGGQPVPVPGAAPTVPPAPPVAGPPVVTEPVTAPVVPVAPAPVVTTPGVAEVAPPDAVPPVPPVAVATAVDASVTAAETPKPPF
jgi:hypothetical protein